MHCTITLSYDHIHVNIVCIILNKKKIIRCVDINTPESCGSHWFPKNSMVSGNFQGTWKHYCLITNPDTTVVGDSDFFINNWTKTTQDQLSLFFIWQGYKLEFETLFFQRHERNKVSHESMTILLQELETFLQNQVLEKWPDFVNGQNENCDKSETH